MLKIIKQYRRRATDRQRRKQTLWAEIGAAETDINARLSSSDAHLVRKYANRQDRAVGSSVAEDNPEQAGAIWALYNLWYEYLQL